MSQENKPNSFKSALLVFSTGILGTAATLISTRQFRIALLSVLTGGACILIVAVITRVINRLHPE